MNPSLPSGSILLTGPTGGLGRATLDVLARRRPEHLILLGRSADGLSSAATTARSLGAQKVSTVVVDLADLSSVAEAGTTVTKLIDGGAPPLSAIILNAGLQMADRHHVSVQGIELTFAVNVVAQHLLLGTLMPAVAEHGHVVMVGSGTHYGNWHSYGMVPPPSWKDPVVLAAPEAHNAPADSKSGSRAYSTSKLGVLFLAHAWQRKVSAHQRINVFDPGLMPGTGLARELTGIQLWAWNHLMPRFTRLPGWSTPRRSAESLVALAAGEQYSALRAGYVEIGRVKPSSVASYDLEREDELVRVCDELIGDIRK